MVIALPWHYNMRDKHYKTRSMRLDDESWKVLKDLRLRYKSWNLLIKSLLEHEKLQGIPK